MANNGEYWARRMKVLEDALLDKPYAYVENLERQFSIAEQAVEKELSVWYQRLAENNEVSLAEARKLLNSRELEEFRWTVEEYIAYGQQNALDGAWMKQLENASARVHISRLEAKKLELQQQAEILYANQLDALDAVARETYQEGYYRTAFEVQKGLGVGTVMPAINEKALEKALARAWTADGQTFRDRCWVNKQALVNSVNTQLTQMIIRGEAPDKAIVAISKQFEVSRAKAGRLVMTESAAIASAAQKDCFGELGVEQYAIVASFDKDTCELCGALDGKVFKMAEYEVGLTAPPFHPWCRCCTAPYFEDMRGIGERWSRRADMGTVKVPADMSFGEWKKAFASGGDKDDLTLVNTSDILKPQKKSKVEDSDVYYIGKLDKDIYRCVTDDIVTDDVIITDTQIQHITERHPGDYEKFFGFFHEIISAPDYIIEANKPNTAILLKDVQTVRKSCKLVLRLAVSTDNPKYKNSIITFMKIDKKDSERLIRNKKVLYKRE